MSNDDVLARRSDSTEKEACSATLERPLVFAENKFVWIAVESLPSADGVQVLRGDTNPDTPTWWGPGGGASSATPAAAQEATVGWCRPTSGRLASLAADTDAAANDGPPSPTGSVPGVVCSSQVLHTAVEVTVAPIESERDARDGNGSGSEVTSGHEGCPEVTRAQQLAADEDCDQARGNATPANGTGDGDASDPPAPNVQPPGRPGPRRSSLAEALAASEGSVLAGQSSNASTLVAGGRISPATSDDDGDSSSGESSDAGGAEGDDQVPPLSGAIKQNGVDRYSNYFEANLALLDAQGYDSLDGLRLNTSPVPEPAYAVPHRRRPPAPPCAHPDHGDDVFEPAPLPVPPPAPPLPPTPLRKRGDPIYEEVAPASPSTRVRSLGEQIYDVISDAVRPVSGAWEDTTIYEDVDGDEAAFETRRQLSSDSSWSEEFESMSEPDPEPDPDPGGEPPPTADSSFSSLRHLLRRKRRTPPKARINGAEPATDTVSQASPAAAAASPAAATAERKSSLEKRPAARRDSDESEGRLSRWFSLRKSSHYDISERNRSLAKMSSVSEDAEAAELLFHRRHQAPALPPAPIGLSADQLKRRHIVQSIVHSENNYVASLHSLVNDYKKVLEETHPPMINSAKISVIFRRVPEILQCHTLFRIALAEAIRQWDAEERIGDVFVASFSKGIVLDTYSDFINNFSVSMETIKQEAKRKSAFADFLRMRQISCADRLSLFGLMVKPVQRFPQFILLLQDLLKHTPHGHHDRMSLQLALTQLESLAEMLNERKRESEQFKAFRETLRRLNGKFSMRSLADSSRYLLRQDNATRLEFAANGSITKSKSRRLFLLNDLVVCVSVATRPAEDTAATERLTLKWSVPVTDVDVLEASTSLTLSHVITASGRPPAGARSSTEDGATELSNVGQLCQKMSDLMHDYEVVSRIGALVSSLKGEYPGLSAALTHEISTTIQQSIRRKDEEIAWLDACCLQLAVRRGGREQQLTFQLESPARKRDWTTDFRLAQLALNGNNSPAWDVPEREQRPLARLPLFVSATAVPAPPPPEDSSTGVVCGCFYSTTIVKPTQRTRQQSYLWICTTDAAGSLIVIYAMQQAGFREVSRLQLPCERVTAMEHVPADWTEAGPRSGTVWVATTGPTGSRLLQYGAQEPEHCRLADSRPLRCPARCLVSLYGAVWAALDAGCLAALERTAEGGWFPGEPALLPLGPGPVTCLLPIGGCVYAGCGRKVSVVDASSREVTKSFTVQEHESSGDVHLLAHSGVGLWISLAHSATICLYHTETFRHLQDINVASNVARVVGEAVRPRVAVTALLAARGLLWVGTSVGATLTIPLPRLEGVPIISGRGNVSYHAHCGPVTFLHVVSASASPACGPPLTPAPHRQAVIREESSSSAPDASASDVSARLEKRRSDTSLSSESRRSVRLQPRLSSPSLLRRRSRDRERDPLTRRLSRTLPRGLGGLPSSNSGSVADDVYGLYGHLLNLAGFEEGRELSELGAQLRRSEPELAALPLDGRLALRRGRPRSLDLSCWSVDSRGSAQTTSSSSEGDRAHSAPASRVQSFRTGEPGAGEALPARKDEPAARSVLTVTAGSGYVNWAQQQHRSSPTAVTHEAYLVLWEMKL